MTGDMLTDIIGYLAGLLLATCFLPQVIRTIRLRRADDVSMGMLAMSLLSALLYETYAIRLGLTPVVVMNGLFAALLVTEMGLKVAFDHRSSPPHADTPR